MAIECYFDCCPFHSAHSDPEGGPYCHESDCRITKKGLEQLQEARDKKLAQIGVSSGLIEIVDEDPEATKAAFERDEKIIAMARAQYNEEGVIEIDEHASVSEGGDNGAYVEAWVWVGFQDTELDKHQDVEIPEN